MIHFNSESPLVRPAVRSRIALACSVWLLALVAASAAPKSGSVQGIGAADDPTRQTDANWVDDRWSKTDVGQFLSAGLDTPRHATHKGIAIKVGDHDEGAVCFDTELMRYSAGWTGGFLQTFPRRYGLMMSPKPVGEIQFSDAALPGWAHHDSFADPRSKSLGPLPRDWAKYHGLYLSGKRVVLAYAVGSAEVLDSPWLELSNGISVLTRTVEMASAPEALRLRVCDVPEGSSRVEEVEGVRMALLTAKETTTAVALVGSGGNLEVGEKSAAQIRVAAGSQPVRFKVLIWRGAKGDLPKFAAFVKTSSSPTALKPLLAGGPPRWTEPVTTKGVVSRDQGPFVIDTLSVPFENPWHALMFTSGHDFFDNGDAAVCTAHGDVWRVSGIDDKLEKLVWKRFATGLYQPLGLKIVGNKVHVIGRDRITILYDLNGDGEADFYENFNSDYISAGGGHSYATCLETDPEGNFYFLKCAEETPHGGVVLRVAKDGSKLDVVATGFRNPNGMGISPSGVITVADQQGEWVPETRLDVIHPGGFYGYMPMHKRAVKPTTFDPPLCWIPRTVDNSAGGQTWVPPNSWGPLGGQMLHLSYGRCTMMLVLRDELNGHNQGAVVPLPGRFSSGVMRARFNSHDGHLYLSGLRGWQTAAIRDGCLQRVRFTAEPVYLPVGFSVHTNGLEFTFSQPLNRELAENVDSYGLERWNYRWSEKYGSPDFSVANPEQEGRDKMTLKAARLSENGRKVFLEIPDLRPAMVTAVQYNIKAADGQLLRGSVYATIEKLAK